MTAMFQAIAEMGYEHMTEVQARTIPQLLTGRDVLGAAKTGDCSTCSMAGETALFMSAPFCNASSSKCRVLHSG